MPISPASSPRRCWRAKSGGCTSTFGSAPASSKNVWTSQTTPLPVLPAPSPPALSPCRHTGAQGGAEATGGFCPYGGPFLGLYQQGWALPREERVWDREQLHPTATQQQECSPFVHTQPVLQVLSQNPANSTWDRHKQSLLVALLFPVMSFFRTQCWQLHPVSTQHLKWFHSPFAGAQFHLGLAPSPFCSGVFVDVPVPFLHACSSSGEFIPDLSHWLNTAANWKPCGGLQGVMNGISPADSNYWEKKQHTSLLAGHRAERLRLKLAVLKSLWKKRSLHVFVMATA